MRKIKILATIAVALSMLVVSVMPAYATEADQFPLKGTFPYSMTTRESIDAKLAEGWVFTGDPYASVGTSVPFRNNAEWSQVNNYKSSTATGINAGKILISLAGLMSAPDSLTGSDLSTEEEAVKNEVIRYLDSYDWRNASEYERAAYTAKYVANRCVYRDAEGDSLPVNSSYSCLLKGVSLCDGFAATYHLLTRAVGLKSVHTGTVGHAWNYVMINGQWFKIDVSEISQDNEVYGNTGNKFEYLTIDYTVKKALESPATDTAQYLWVDMGTELNFDRTIPNQPTY